MISAIIEYQRGFLRLYSLVGIRTKGKDGRTLNAYITGALGGSTNNSSGLAAASHLAQIWRSDTL
jgi:hypothetical protein